MKTARLVCAALAVLVSCCWIGSVVACDKDKAAKAMMISASNNGTCSAEKAAACTAEQAAACKAHMRGTATTASASGCPYHNGASTAVTAVTAAMPACPAAGCPAMPGCPAKTAAVTASASGCDHAGAAMTASSSCAAKTSAVTASSSSCAAKTSAMAAGSKDCCAKDGATAAAKTAKARTLRVMAANEDGHCGGTGMAGIASPILHDGCEACADMASFSADLDQLGVQRQIVRLKNGAMIVYSAATPSRVSAVQATVSTRGEHLARYASAGEKAHLCSECRTIRGAMASGKLSREVVNIEGGTLMLLTSTDPAMVARIHAMTDTKVATRIKS